MRPKHNEPLVTTIRERCRVCYTCVRECPAKAIRIVDRQAEVIPDRCIGCGQCVRVCSQHAKRVASDVDRVEAGLARGVRAAAVLAPSFPAEFVDVDYETLVGMVRALGFALVGEVSFGADLVAHQYRILMSQSQNPGKPYIATTCPAIVGFVERYHPNLVDSLAPIVSPMIAAARAFRRRYGDDLRVVFIGPCIAKRGEVATTNDRRDVDASMTFIELRELLARKGIRPDNVTPSDFDPPHGALGALLPVRRGLLQAAQIDEDLLRCEVVSAEGQDEFVQAIREFESGEMNIRLLELLCCDGCIMGPGIGQDTPLFRRRAQVARYAQWRLNRLDLTTWEMDVASFQDLDLSRVFTADDQRIPPPSEEDIRAILERMGKKTLEDELNCGACGYETCREHAIAIYKGLAESEMCLPYTIEQLRAAYDQLTTSHRELASTQEALMQSEKLASMGQLAAGIAHEVNNPLGTVLMLSHVLLDEVPTDSELRDDLTLIAREADRCKKIVAGLLHFARKNKVEARQTNLRELVDGFTRLLQLPANISLQVDYEDGDASADIDRDQVLQVLTNLVSNAVAAMPDGGTLTLSTRGNGERVHIAVADTGVGIPQANRKRVFEPFFTTKPAGEGTGLGLAVIYGIVKMHQGDIRLETNADPAAGPTGTTFTVSLPRKRDNAGLETAGAAP